MDEIILKELLANCSRHLNKTEAHSEWDDLSDMIWYDIKFKVIIFIMMDYIKVSEYY